MVRETRHLWVGNLPENIREEEIVKHFTRSEFRIFNFWRALGITFPNIHILVRFMYFMYVFATMFSRLRFYFTQSFHDWGS